MNDDKIQISYNIINSRHPYYASLKLDSRKIFVH